MFTLNILIVFNIYHLLWRIKIESENLDIIKLSQKWFILNRNNSFNNNQTEYRKRKWYIPFTYTTKNESYFEFQSGNNTAWLTPKDDNEIGECIMFLI